MLLRMLLCMLEAVEGRFCLLEVPEVMRCVLLCTLLRMLEVSEVMRCVRLCMLQVPEVMRCVLLCILDAVEGTLCLLQVPEAICCVLGTLYAMRVGVNIHCGSFLVTIR